MTTFLDDTTGPELMTTLAGALGGDIKRIIAPNVYRPEGKVLMLQADGSPVPGITSWITVGCCERDLSELGFPDRLEVMMACGSEWPELARVLAVVMSHVIEQGWIPLPGTLVRDAVSACGLGPISERLPHVAIDAPFAWGDRLERLPVGDQHITAVLAFPVSDAEADFLEANGRDAFAELLTAKEVAVFDLDRESAV